MSIPNSATFYLDDDIMVEWIPYDNIKTDKYDVYIRNTKWNFNDNYMMIIKDEKPNYERSIYIVKTLKGQGKI